MASLVASRELTILSGRRYPDGSPVRIEVAEGRIRSIVSADRLDEAAGTQRWIAPGFYDLQVNGFAGIDLADPAVGVQEIRRVAEAVLRTGCTRFLPTIITGDIQAMCSRLSALAEAVETDPLVAAMCPGMHVEGPFIHPEDGPRGAHPREHVLAPNLPDFERLFDACRGRMRILTLAPERPGALPVIAEASRRSVLVALGHHRADCTAIDAAVRAGARMTTHLGNGSDAMLPRHDNYVWWQLGEDCLWASLIADGHHLPPATLKSMLRAKTPGRVVLITDAMAAAGMPAGRFLLGESEVIKEPQGRVCLPGTPYLAGSAAEMPLVVARAVVDGELDLPTALCLAAIQPAQLVPTAIDPWKCEPGAPANLVEFDWLPADETIRVRRTVIGPFAA